MLARVGFGDHALGPGGGNGEAFARLQRRRRLEPDHAWPLVDHPSISIGGAGHTGINSTLAERGGFGQANLSLSAVDGEAPAIAGHVPVKLVESVEAAELARGAVAEHVAILAGFEPRFRIADLHPDTAEDRFA